MKRIEKRKKGIIAGMSFKNQYKHFLILICALSLLFTVSCQGNSGGPNTPTSTSSPTITGQFTLYAPVKRDSTPTPPQTVTSQPALPSPTPTPRSHEVKKGEDLFGISLRYGVTLAELMAANPDVNPNFLSIGTVLTIPVSQTPQPSGEPPAPTPVPVALGPVDCAQIEDRSVICFVLAKNTRDVSLENISAVIRLSDSRAQTIVPQAAFLLLDILPAGAAMPLAALFSPESITALTPPFRASAELQTAFPFSEQERYLPARVSNTVVKINEIGNTASITTEVLLEVEESTAKRIWVAAVAYDNQGRVTGVRRWDNAEDQALMSGQVLPVAMNIYSVFGPIERVELFAEARP